MPWDRAKHGFQPGKSGNPNGRPSPKNDIKRAALIGVPVEVSTTINEWLEDGASRLAELGAEGFLSALRVALDEATKRVLPLDPAEARAMWWRTILPIAFAGPQKDKDTNWTYAHSEVGNRLLGKAREHVVLESAESTPINWSKVPEDRREHLLGAIMELQGYLGEPESATEH